MVRATRKIRSCARAVSPRREAALTISFRQSSSSWQCCRRLVPRSRALQSTPVFEARASWMARAAATRARVIELGSPLPAVGSMS